MKKILEQIRSEFGKDITEWIEKPGRRVYLKVPASLICEIAKFLFADLGARLATASGVDTPYDRMEILYHFSFDKYGYIVSVRVDVAKPALEIESLAPIIKGAEWIEREMHELLGINFKNHPNLKHLLLADEWPEGKYPLRRDYSG